MNYSNWRHRLRRAIAYEHTEEKLISFCWFWLDCCTYDVGHGLLSGSSPRKRIFTVKLPFNCKREERGKKEGKRGRKEGRRGEREGERGEEGGRGGKRGKGEGRTRISEKGNQSACRLQYCKAWQESPSQKSAVTRRRLGEEVAVNTHTMGKKFFGKVRDTW